MTGSGNSAINRVDTYNLQAKVQRTAVISFLLLRDLEVNSSTWHRDKVCSQVSTWMRAAGSKKNVHFITPLRYGQKFITTMSHSLS